jgi:hypothetical protein
MLSNLSDLLNQRVDPKTTQQAPPPRATAADSTFLLNQVQQRNPQLKQFYTNPNTTHPLYHSFVNNEQGVRAGLSQQQRANYFPPVQNVAEGTKKRVATEKARIVSGQAPKTKKGQDIIDPQEVANIQNDESGFIAPNVYQGRNFNPGTEGQNIDFNAPYAVYDPRIEAQQIRVSDSPAGMFTNTIPVYDPLAITPWAQLSKEDQKLRLEKYGTVSTPYENKIDLLPSDGSGSMRMSVPVQGSPTGRIAVKGSGISGSSQGGNNKKATGSIRVTGGGGNVPPEAVFLTKGKKSAKGQGKGQGQEQVVIQDGQGQGQVVAPPQGQSTTSMLGMAPESTYIQNAPTNTRQQVVVDENGYEYSQPYKMVNNPSTYGLLNQPTTLSGQNLYGGESNFNPNAVVVDGLASGMNAEDYETLPYGFVRKKVSKKQGGVPAGLKNETSKMSKEEASKYVEDYYKNQENKKWWESISAKK